MWVLLHKQFDWLLVSLDNSLLPERKAECNDSQTCKGSECGLICEAEIWWQKQVKSQSLSLSLPLSLPTLTCFGSGSSSAETCTSALAKCVFSLQVPKTRPPSMHPKNNLPCKGMLNLAPCILHWDITRSKIHKFDQNGVEPLNKGSGVEPSNKENSTTPQEIAPYLPGGNAKKIHTYGYELQSGTLWWTSFMRGFVFTNHFSGFSLFQAILIYTHLKPPPALGHLLGVPLNWLLGAPSSLRTALLIWSDAGLGLVHNLHAGGRRLPSASGRKKLTKQQSKPIINPTNKPNQPKNQRNSPTHPNNKQISKQPTHSSKTCFKTLQMAASNRDVRHAVLEQRLRYQQRNVNWLGAGKGLFRPKSATGGLKGDQLQESFWILVQRPLALSTDNVGLDIKTTWGFGAVAEDCQTCFW